MRTIFHLDMDAFFVSVEELYDPSLKGKPVVVGGAATDRGVVSAASYAARKFGVHSAMPLRTAALLCPHAIFVPGHPTRYREASGEVFEVLNRFSPRVEMASIDEAYLDLTGTERLLGRPLEAAHKLHEAIKQATQLNCSIGVSTSKLVSKVASDQAKPNGILWVQPGAEPAFLAPLDVRKIPGVGKATEQNLHACGIRKVGDLAALDVQFLSKKFGKWGLALAGKSKGLDAGGWFDTGFLIGDGRNAKSISHEHTFGDDTADARTLEATLAHLSEKVGRRVREGGVFATNIHIKLRYSDFSTFTRSRTLKNATQLDIDIFETSRELFYDAWRRGEKIRLLGVYAGGFDDHEGQLDLMESDRKERWSKALQAADKLRDKYGEKTVALAAGMKGTFRERVHENPAGLPGAKKPK
ncbi:MAG: DNA polymerase IV [Acidobacteria bacterium]|nr:DNA polymerase IV [Acidobacteriota bacterium]